LTVLSMKILLKHLRLLTTFKNYFNRFFKKMTGLTPTAYRQDALQLMKSPLTI
jgi:methylphosphotriester-DNA--protein-cysteine methyltransferase